MGIPIWNVIRCNMLRNMQRKTLQFTHHTKGIVSCEENCCTWQTRIQKGLQKGETKQAEECEVNGRQKRAMEQDHVSAIHDK